MYLIISTSKHDLPIRRTSAMSKVVRQQSRWQLHGLSRFLGSESYQTTRRFVPISRPKLHRWARLSLGTISVVLRGTIIPRIIWRIYAFRRTAASTASRLGTRNVVEWHDLKARSRSHSRLGSGALKKREEKKNRSRDLLQGYRDQSLEARLDLCYPIGDPEFLLFGKRSGSRV